MFIPIYFHRPCYASSQNNGDEFMHLVATLTGLSCQQSTKNIPEYYIKHVSNSVHARAGTKRKVIRKSRQKICRKTVTWFANLRMLIDT